MGIKKESFAGNVRADISKDQSPYIIANPNGQIKLLHEDTSGFIALFRKTKDGTRQYHYKRHEIEQHLHEWMYPDSYISMNTFYTPKRLITNLKEIRAAYVDIDCHNVGASAESTAVMLKRDYFGKSIPTPNMMIYSGRGLNLVWFMDPLSGLAIDRWDKLQKAIYETVKGLGADNGALDAARVFRLAGTTNSKSGNQVFCEVLSEARITFNSFVKDYFPNILKRPKKPVKVLERKSNTKGRVAHLYNGYTLIKARMKDIETLTALRNGNMEGCREYALFLYRYWALVDTNDQERAKEAMLKVNNSFSEPLPEREALGDTKSAEKYHESEVPFKISSGKIIKWLNITKEEQKEMLNIISPTEKKHRNTLSKREKRRENGVLERSEYDAGRKTVVADRKQQLQQLLELHPEWSNVKLSEEMGISEGYVRKLKKQIL